MLKTIAVVLALVAFATAQIGLSSNSTAMCASTCYWDDPAVWDQNRVPNVNEAVTLMALDVLNLVIRTPVSVGSFDISDKQEKAQSVKIVSGGSLTISGTSTLGITSTLQIDSGAFFTIGGQITNQGFITISGNMTCNGGLPSLAIDTKNGQLTARQVYATVTLDNGYLVLASTVSVSSTANLIGNGYVVGKVTSTGTISVGTKTAVGTLYITGQLDVTSSAAKVGNSQIYIKVASVNSFDRLIIGDTFFQDGNLYIEPLNDYEPLRHTQFIVANHTAQRGGFDNVRGSGFTGVFNNQWTVAVDQEYTAVIFGSASTVAVSFLVLVICALVSSL